MSENEHKLRAISLWQPWASAMMLGLKRIETRAWVSRYTGPLAVHAAQKRSRENERAFYQLLRNKKIYAAFHRAGIINYDNLPFGRVLCLVRMRHCQEITKQTVVPESERWLGDYRVGRQAWICDNARPLKAPFAVCGRQGFFWVRIPDQLLPAAVPGVCRLCGCTEDRACLSKSGVPCHWVESDLCSACGVADAARTK